MIQIPPCPHCGKANLRMVFHCFDCETHVEVFDPQGFLSVTVSDEMIERACKAFDQEDIVNGATGTWATNWTRPLIVRVLRAALEVPE